MLFQVLIATALLTFTQAAEIHTAAGTGKSGYSGDGGKATETELNQPFGVVFRPGNGMLFCDTNNHIIRSIDAKGIIRTLVGTGGKGYTGDGGPAEKATLNEPYEVRTDPTGATVYWVERMNHVVRKLSTKTGVVNTIAGTGKLGYSGDGGPGTEAMLNQPHSIQFDAEGKKLFICDIKNHRLRKKSAHPRTRRRGRHKGRWSRLT